MFTVSLPTGTLRNVRDDRDRCTSQLRCQTESFTTWKVSGLLIDTHNKTVCVLPDRELPVISHATIVPAPLAHPYQISAAPSQSR
jgi:hypothetical protein